MERLAKMKIRQDKLEEEEEEEEEICGKGRKEEENRDKGEESEGDERRKIDAREGLEIIT